MRESRGRRHRSAEPARLLTFGDDARNHVPEHPLSGQLPAEGGSAEWLALGRAVLVDRAERRQEGRCVLG